MADDAPAPLGPLRGPGSLAERMLARGGFPGGVELPADARSFWSREDPPEGSQRALKHRLVEQVRRLVGGAALLDQEVADTTALEALLAEATALADRLGAQPSLLAHGGLASVGGADSTLAERSPFMGRANPLAPPMHLHAEGDLTRGWAVWPDAYEGPPATVHGGFVAAAFDDLMGFAQSASGTAGYTGTLTVRMRRPTPLNHRIEYLAGVDRVEGRKIYVWGRSTISDVLLADCEILFIEPRRD